MRRALFRSRGRVVDVPGQAAAPAGRAAPGRNGRRAWLLAGAAASLALVLQGCSLAPRRSSRVRTQEGDLEMYDDHDQAAGGAGSEVVMQALANVGKPYRWGGSNPREGFDCSGLVAHVYDDALGIRLPRTSREMSRRGDKVDRGELAAGDLVFFNTSRRAYSHVGIYVGRGRFVHAPSSGSLVRVERLTNSYWSSRFNGGRRLVAQ